MLEFIVCLVVMILICTCIVICFSFHSLSGVLGDNIRSAHVAFSLMPELFVMTSLLYSPANAAKLGNLSKEKVIARVNVWMTRFSESLRRLLFSFSPSGNSMSFLLFVSLSQLTVQILHRFLVLPMIFQRTRMVALLLQVALNLTLMVCLAFGIDRIHD
jgi:hypothetical protein